MTKVPTGPVSRRATPAKAPLTRGVIVRTGLAVLDRDGMDALTMRKVAKELDTGAASLYVYVRNRDDLLAAMLDEALAAVPLPGPGRGSWRERLTALVEATVEAMGRHQGLALVSLGRVPTGDNALLIVESMVGLLREGGLDDATVSWAVDLINLYVGAAAAEESAHRGMAEAGETESGVIAAVAQRYASLPPDRFPMIVTMREQLVAGSGDRRSAWALRVLLNGILATPAV